MARRESRSKRQARKEREAAERALRGDAGRQTRAMGIEEAPATKGPAGSRPQYVGSRSPEEMMDFGRGPTGRSMKMPPGAPMGGPMSMAEGLLDVGPVPGVAAAGSVAAGAAENLPEAFRELPEITKALQGWLSSNKNMLPRNMEEAKTLLSQMGVTPEQIDDILSQKHWYGMKSNPLKEWVEKGFKAWNAQKAVGSMNAEDLAKGLTRGFTPVVDMIKGEAKVSLPALAKNTKTFGAVVGGEVGLTGLVPKGMAPFWKVANVVGIVYGVGDLAKQLYELQNPVPSEGSEEQRIQMARASMISPEDQIYQDMANEAQINQTLGSMAAYPFLLDKMGQGMAGGGQPRTQPGVLPTEISSAGRGGEQAVEPTSGPPGEDLLGLGM